MHKSKQIPAAAKQMAKVTHIFPGVASTLPSLKNTKTHRAQYRKTRAIMACANQSSEDFRQKSKAFPIK